MKKGDRVKYSQEWLGRGNPAHKNNIKQAARRGTVKSVHTDSHSGRPLATVHWDGLKLADTYAVAFLEVIPAEEAVPPHLI